MLAPNAAVDSEVRVGAEEVETTEQLTGALESRAREGENDGRRQKNFKIRRLDDPPLTPDEWTHELHSADGGHKVECKFSVSAAHECGIMHEPTHLVEIADLPQAWPRGDDVDATLGPHANTAHLPCGHVFSPCALAFHFLVQDMRCPICRVGCKTRMNILCVPACIRAIYAKKVEQSETAELVEVETVDIVSFLTQMNLQVLLRFQRQSSRALRSSAAQSTQVESLIYSRLLVNEEDIAGHVHAINQISQRNLTGEHEPELEQRAPADSASDFATLPREPADADRDPNFFNPPVMGIFHTHRSFQRIIQSILERQDASSNVQFMLQHPLMPLEISSAEMNVSIAHTTLFGEEARAPVSIPLFCSAISGVEPIAYIHSVYDQTHNTADISVGVNLGVMVNMAVYVTQVLDHLSGIAD